MAFTYLDAALVAIVAISGVVAMYAASRARCCRFLSWIAAAAAASTSSSSQSRGAAGRRQFHAPLLVAQVGIGGLIFLVVLIVVHLITSRISDTVLDSRVGAIDRILGLAFGVARGLRAGGHPLHVLRGLRRQAGAAVPWVRDAVSRPYMPVDGDSLRDHPAAPRALLADGAGAAARRFSTDDNSLVALPVASACKLSYIVGAPRGTNT